MPRSLVVVGGTSAIGQALIRSLDRGGFYNRILVHGHRHLDCVSTLAKEVKMELIPFGADLSRPEGATTLLEAVKKELGVPYGLAWLAAKPVMPLPLRSLASSEVREQMEVQFFSAISILKGLCPDMARAGGGRIVLMLSSYTKGKVPQGLSHYVPAKFALLGLMHCLVAEFGGKGLVVNGVSPSMVDTPFLGGLPASVLEAQAKEHPLGRLAVVEDVVPHLEHLLTLEGDYLQGENLGITGGASH